MQQIHDAISDVALANAIECNGHAGPSEGDAIGCKLEALGAPALAFLAGYGVETVFRMLDGLAEQFSSAKK
jgi:hypothetical protein